MQVGGVGQGKLKIQCAFAALKKLGMRYLSTFSGMNEMFFDGFQTGDSGE
jgi:hypothetical protein